MSLNVKFHTSMSESANVSLITRTFGGNSTQTELLEISGPNSRAELISDGSCTTLTTCSINNAEQVIKNFNLLN